MKVFLSWSGPASKELALTLREWIPSVIQAAIPWMSEVDIGSGARWSAEVVKELEQTSVGVLCLTPDNLHADWIMFKAGALSKKVGESYVCPYCLGISPVDLAEPISQFQASQATKQGTFKLMTTINRSLGERALPADRFSKSFDRAWPELQKTLASISLAEITPVPERTERELLEEILETVRETARISRTSLSSGLKRLSRAPQNLAEAALSDRAYTLDEITAVLASESGAQPAARKRGTLREALLKRSQAEISQPDEES